MSNIASKIIPSFPSAEIDGVLDATFVKETATRKFFTDADKAALAASTALVAALQAQIGALQNFLIPPGAWSLDGTFGTIIGVAPLSTGIIGFTADLADNVLRNSNGGGILNSSDGYVTTN